jgi:hypothetical protein
MRKRFARISVIVVAVCAFVFAMDVAGGRTLARDEQRWRDATVEQSELLRRYRRQFVVGDPVDQNAASWYRLVFEKLRSRTAEMHRDLLPLVTSNVPEAGRIDAAYRNWCAEAESPRVRAALASTVCYWEMPYDFQDPASNGWFQAIVLGECSALIGSRYLERRDWAGSAFAFLTTLAVASDFGQGSIEMNVVGVTAAQWAVHGFAEAMSRIDDVGQIDRLSNQFARLETVTPSFRVGLAQQQLARALQASSMARAYAYDHRYGFRALVPWRAIAAWRLSRLERLVSKVSLLTSRSDPAERSRILTELSQPGPLSAPIVPSTLGSALTQQDRLISSVRAVRTVIKLQEWYARHGEYPATPPETLTHDVEYERTNGGKGYRLRTRSETETSELFFERMPDTPAS